MNRYLVCLLLGTSSLAWADGTFSTIPGWHMGWRNRGEYTLTIDRSDAYNGTSSAVLVSRPDLLPGGFASIVQFATADQYRGRRVHLSCALKTSGVQDWVGLWIQADDMDSSGVRTVVGESIQGKKNGGVHGDTPWHTYSLVLDIPEHSSSITYGAELSGIGKVWFDSVQIEVVAQDVPVSLKTGATGTRYPPPLHAVLAAPTNLDFEE